MKLNSLLFLSLFIIWSSCNGQTNSQSTATDILNAPVDKGDPVKELGKNIMLIYQDKKNNYWFGSWENGLYRYDGKTILHFTSKNALPHNRIEEIKEDHSGNIYINTSKGICKFDGQTFTTLPTIESNEWKLQPGDLWFKGDKGPYRYDGKMAYHLKLPKHFMEGKSFEVNPAHSWSPYDIYTIYKDSHGNIWFGTAVLGACRYNGKTIDWISEEDVTELHDGPSNGVRSIIEDKDGFFWFNSMYRYNVYHNKNKQTFYSKEKSIGSLDGKQDGDFYEYLSIAKDNNNELWIATYMNGVWRFNGKNIVHYPVQDGTKDISIFSIYKDNNGDLWLGTHENGAFKFNGTTFERFKQ